jgi:hypothetical protein
MFAAPINFLGWSRGRNFAKRIEPEADIKWRIATPECQS